jgi:hypothetical protein
LRKSSARRSKCGLTRNVEMVRSHGLATNVSISSTCSMPTRPVSSLLVYYDLEFVMEPKKGRGRKAASVFTLIHDSEDLSSQF